MNCDGIYTVLVANWRKKGGLPTDTIKEHIKSEGFVSLIDQFIK